MRVDLFDFELPTDRIALRPARPRDAARLLFVPGQGDFADKGVLDLPDLLQPGDVLVFNDTRVLNARFFGTKETGGKVEVLVERVSDATTVLGNFLRDAMDEIVYTQFTLSLRGDVTLWMDDVVDDVAARLKQDGHRHEIDKRRVVIGRSREVADRQAKGVEFHGEPFDTGVCHMAFFRDPDGLRLEVFTPTGLEDAMATAEGPAPLAQQHRFWVAHAEGCQPFDCGHRYELEFIEQHTLRVDRLRSSIG